MKKWVSDMWSCIGSLWMFDVGCVIGIVRFVYNWFHTDYMDNADVAAVHLQRSAMSNFGLIMLKMNKG